MPPLDPELARAVEDAARTLRAGGIVAYPTETFYGLGALARDPRAVARVAGAKGRPEGKPLPLVAADLAAVEAVAALGPLARRLAARFWPGPLTLVLPARAGLAPEIDAGTGTVGVRVPGGDVARALAAAAGGAIVSTSANLAGALPVVRAEDLDPGLRARLDAVLDAGPTPGGLASTVVAVEGAGVRLVRAGAVAWEDVRAVARRG